MSPSNKKQQETRNKKRETPLIMLVGTGLLALVGIGILVTLIDDSEPAPPPVLLPKPKQAQPDPQPQPSRFELTEEARPSFELGERIVRNILSEWHRPEMDFVMVRTRLLRAIKALDESVRLCKFYPETYFVRGLAHMKLYDLDAAERNFTRALEWDDRYHPALVARGEVRRLHDARKRRADAGTEVPPPASGAADDLRAAGRLRANPTLDALIALAEGRPNDCLKLCERILPPPHHARGAAYQALGRAEEAVADYTRVLEGTPHDVELLSRRGTLHRQEGRSDAAQRDFEKILRIKKGDGYAHEMIGAIELERGRALEEPTARHNAFVRAQRATNQAISADRTFRRLLQRARVHRERGMTTEAARDFGNVLEEFPLAPDVRAALEREKDQ